MLQPPSLRQSPRCLHRSYCGNGNDIVFRVAVKPTSSIGMPQDTMNFKSGNVETLLIDGRHDACIALRVPVVVECAAAIVLADLLLLEQRKPRVFHD